MAGVVDTSLIRKLQKDREKSHQSFEKQKQQIRDENSNTSKSFGSKFGKSQTEILEQSFKKDTIGLKTKEDFRQLREDLEKKELILSDLKEEERLKDEERKALAKRKARKSQIKKTQLSFSMDDEEGEDGGAAAEEEVPAKKPKIIKNPDVDTSFLPDREREQQELQERQRLMSEWHEEDMRKRNEPLEVVFTYWDGSGHRMTLTCTRGTTVGQFLRKAQVMISEEHREMRNTPIEKLMYVKEDLIIPHDYTFHWLIENKARGKSGPLFCFDQHDDVRMLMDATKEKNESHAGKVLDRTWYERNKHIFPASRWEVFDPAQVWEKYTVKDTKKR